MILPSAVFLNRAGSEWLLIVLVVAIIFGPRSLPKMGHTIRGGIRDWMAGTNGRDPEGQRPKSSSQWRNERNRRMVILLGIGLAILVILICGRVPSGSAAD